MIRKSKFVWALKIWAPGSRKRWKFWTSNDKQLVARSLATSTLRKVNAPSLALFREHMQLPVQTISQIARIATPRTQKSESKRRLTSIVTTTKRTKQKRNVVAKTLGDFFERRTESG